MADFFTLITVSKQAAEMDQKQAEGWRKQTEMCFKWKQIR